MFRESENSDRKGFLSVDVIPQTIINEESVLNQNYFNLTKEDNEQCLSELGPEEIIGILKNAQIELKDTKKKLKKIEHNYGAFKIKNQVLGRRFNETLQENKEKCQLIETLKKENQTLIVCVMKMLKIFQKQNENLIDHLFENMVNLIISYYQKNFNDLVELVNQCEKKFEEISKIKELDNELEQKTWIKGEDSLTKKMDLSVERSSTKVETKNRLKYFSERLKEHKFSLPANILKYIPKENLSNKSTTSSKFKLKRNRLKLRIDCSRDNSNLVDKDKESSSSETSNSVITKNEEKTFNIEHTNTNEKFRSFTEIRSNRNIDKNYKNIKKMKINNIPFTTRMDLEFSKLRLSSSVTSKAKGDKKSDFLMYTERESEPVNLKQQLLEENQKKVVNLFSEKLYSKEKKTNENVKNNKRNVRKAATRRETPTKIKRDDKEKAREFTSVSMLNIKMKENSNKKKKNLKLLKNLMKGNPIVSNQIEIKNRELFKSQDNSPFGRNIDDSKLKNSNKTSKKKQNIQILFNKDKFYKLKTEEIPSPLKKKDNLEEAKKTSIRQIVDSMKSLHIKVKKQKTESNFNKIYKQVSKIEEKKRVFKERVHQLKSSAKRMKRGGFRSPDFKKKVGDYKGDL